MAEALIGLPQEWLKNTHTHTLKCLEFFLADSHILFTISGKDVEGFRMCIGEEWIVNSISRGGVHKVTDASCQHKVLA